MMRGVVLLLLALAAPLAAQRTERAGTSTFTPFTDRDGFPCTRTVNVRFFADGTRPEATVYRERTTVSWCEQREGLQGEIVLEGWPVGSRAARPAFTATVAGDHGELTGPWYRVRQPGCCGTGDDWVHLSPGNGTMLFTSSLPEPLRIVDGERETVVAVHDSYSAVASPEMERDSSTVAVLQIGGAAGPFRRLAVRSTGCLNQSVDSLEFVGASAPEAGRPPQSARIVLRLRPALACPSDASWRIELPIADGTLTPERASVPRGITLQWSPPTP